MQAAIVEGKRLSKATPQPQLVEIVASLKRRGALAIVLGCTDLPSLLPPELGLPLIDPMDFLVKEAAARLAGTSTQLPPAVTSAVPSAPATTSVTVIGAGIIGLTAAIALLDAGYQVRVCAKAIEGSEVVSQAMAGWWIADDEYTTHARDRRWARRALHTNRTRDPRTLN